MNQYIAAGLGAVALGYFTYLLTERKSLLFQTPGASLRRRFSSDTIQGWLLTSGVKWTVKQYLMYQAAAVAFGAVLVLMQPDLRQGFAMGAFALFIPALYIRGERRKRAQEIRPQIPVMLRRVQRGVEQGLGWREIFLSLPDSVEEGVFRDELTRLASTYIAQPVLKDRLEEFARRIDLPEVDSFALALGQSEYTGRVLEMLQKLEDIIKRDMAHEETRRMKKKAELAPVFPTMMVLNIVVLVGLPLLLAFFNMTLLDGGPAR
ncbi:hypothetical protein GTO91_15780 [Heliobacterium undosum]|uniref:Type II secretion system protein GspF domain-containing protein n=1 Tax=Heliomicrobium undosum TaxID=121734 RepID=A0A845L3G3_9FIRM|nr:hypothetical protein [Heliomicrobium undosum]MZP31167.1 hypothetical protein [Heliomicrobium undosum]